MNSNISFSLQDKTEIDLKQLQSSTIDLLRFPLAIMVIFIHYAPQVVNVMEADFSLLSGRGIYNLLGIIFSYVLPNIAVPTFFLISGFLFFLNFQHWSWKGYGKKIRSRVKTLIIPYLLWNLFPFVLLIMTQLVDVFHSGKALSEVWQYIQANFIHVFYDIHHWNAGVNWLGEKLVLTGPYNLPLWFLRDLIVVTFLSPIIFYAIKKFRIFTLLFLFLAYISMIWIQVPGFQILAFFYFATGAYFALNGINIVSFVNKNRYIIIPLSVILLVVSTLYCGTETTVISIAFPLFICSTVFASFYVASYCIKKYGVKPNKLLVSSCFFIYALHNVAIPGIGTIILSSQKIWHAIIPGNSWVDDILCYFISPFFAAAICIIVLIICRKTIPRITLLFSGNK